MVEIVGRDMEVLKIVTCTGCASILRYGDVDVRRYVMYANSFSKLRRYKYINCPSCGTAVAV